ncbi:MAG: hypothetical protein ACI4QS_00845 [Comamonas sp.]
MRIRRLRTTMRLLLVMCNGKSACPAKVWVPYRRGPQNSAKWAVFAEGCNRLFERASWPFMIGIDIEAVEIVRIAGGGPALKSPIGVALGAYVAAGVHTFRIFLSALS